MTIVRAASLLGIYNGALALGPLSFLACAVSLVVRLVRSRGEQRLQLKWFVYASALAATTVALRPDQEQAPPVTRNRSAGRGEHDSIETAQVEHAALAAEEPHLVAEDSVLELQGPDRGTAAEPAQGPGA